MIECGPHTWLFIKQKMQTWEYGLQIFQKLFLTHPVWQTTHTIFWQDIIITLHLVLMYQKEDIIIHTMITWLLLCLHNSMMVWLNMMMELHHLLLKWLMMFQNIFHLYQKQKYQIKRLFFALLLPFHSQCIQFHIYSQNIIMLTAIHID